MTMKMWMGILAVAVGACGSNETDPTNARVTVADQGLAPTHATLEGVAPDHLVVDGSYSDVRFCDMMAPHHQHAIEMAEVLLAHGSNPDLRAMARAMISAQRSEIEELASIKAGLTGSSTLPRMSTDHTMQNSGTPMPEELTHGTSVDLAFLDGMLPHHAGAIQMASVALRHSQNGHIVGLARRIIDAQAREIGDLGTIRQGMSPTVNHGFPHAGGAP